MKYREFITVDTLSNSSQYNHVTMGRKIIYGSGDLAASLVYFSISFFYLYYLTDGVKMDPRLAGIAWIIGQVWDGVNDPIMGVISDRTNSKYGRKRVYILFGAIPLALSFILLWYVPVVGGSMIQFAFATVSLLLYTTAYTVVSIPYVSLVPLMSSDYDERTSIISIRSVLSTVGTIAGAGVAIFISNEDGSVDLDILHLVVILFGVITAIIYILVAHDARKIKEQDDTIRNQFSDYFGVLTDRNVSTLLTVKFTGAIATGMLVASMPYYAEYILGDEGFSTLGLGIYIIVSASFIPLYSHLTTILEKRKILLITNLVVASVLIFLAYTVSSANISFFYIGTALLGVFMAAYLLIPYSMVPDLVEYYQYNKSQRHESVFFALWSATHSIGIGVAGFLLTQVLHGTGYNADISVQSESALGGIKANFGLIPAIFMIITAIILQKYTVTRETFNTYLSDSYETE